MIGETLPLSQHELIGAIEYAEIACRVRELSAALDVSINRRVLLAGSSQIRGRTRPEGTKPEAVLRFGHMALSVPLRGEIVLD